MNVTVQEGTTNFRRFLQGDGEPSWLLASREEGLSHYEKLPSPPLPSRERDIPSLNPDQLSFDPADAGQTSIESANGKTVAIPLKEALKAHGEKILAHLGKAALPEKTKWVALNQALWRKGSFVRIPRGTDAGMVSLAHTLPSRSLLFLPRVLVLAEPGSRVTLLDIYEDNNPHEIFSVPVVEIFASEDAEVNYLHLQKLGKNTHHHPFVKIIADQHAKATSFSCFLGGKRTSGSLQVTLQGKGSSAQILGVAVGDDEQIFEQYTLQEHLAPHTESDLLIKVALKETAYSHFDGLIWIEKGAGQTNAYQQNRNLLLSKEARAESTPRLEILDNDVRCTHGASVGPVDEEQVFYLQSRGIDPHDAESLIVEGFFQQVLEKLRPQELREKIQGEITAKLR